MAHAFTEMFPYLMTVLGVVLMIMVGNVLKDNADNSQEIQQLRKDFNELTLTIAKLTPTLVSVDSCARTRDTCITLNKKIIEDPIRNDIKRIDDEFEQVWSALGNHLHTDSGIIMKGKNNR